MELVACRIQRLIVDERNDRHIITLRPCDTEDDRRLMMIIGPFEAMAIDRALRQEPFPRPLTHDLLLSVLEANYAELRAVEIRHSEDATYFAELVLTRADQEERRIDCRPSDGLALWARLPETLLLINSELLEET